MYGVTVGVHPSYVMIHHYVTAELGLFHIAEYFTCEYSRHVPFAGSCLCVIFRCCTYYSLLFVGRVT